MDRFNEQLPGLWEISAPNVSAAKQIAHGVHSELNAQQSAGEGLMCKNGKQDYWRLGGLPERVFPLE